MNRNLLIAAAIVVAFAAGLVMGPDFAINRQDESDSVGPAPEEKKILFWVAPMDPNFKRDKPGKSPMGMDLVPVYEDSASDGVRISPAVENNLGVRTETAGVRPLWRRIEATGYVGFDETRISHINTRVEGWIVKLRVDAEGERVSTGDLLFEFYSPQLVNAQKEYLQALSRGGARLLGGAGEKLRALGMIPSEIDALAKRGTASENIRIVAPQDGVVTSLNVREGMYIQPNTPIMSLADLSSVWLQAEIFESQASWVAEGQAAEARLDYMPGTEFSGQVEYVYPVLDPTTRTLRVRLRFDNPHERLKPNMYAQVSIYGSLKPNALSIPREALIPAPGHDRVVVAVGEGKFHVHEVITGLESGDYVEVLAGIYEGDEVVTSSQFLIDSEASLAGSINRLESGMHLPERKSVGAVYASGRVEDVEIRERRVRVAHGPIDVLGWPSMTMVFEVLPDVDLDPLRAGDDIRFSLVQQQAGEYMIEQILSADNGLTGTSEFPEAVDGGPDEEPSTSAREVDMSARIKGMDPENHKLTLSHDPVPELGWPSMIMDFNVAAAVSLDDLREGQAIRFTMVETENGAWIIEKINAAGDIEEEDHQHD